MIGKADITTAADPAWDDDASVLVEANGTLSVISDDPERYQRPHLWPRYLCRVSAIRSQLARMGDDPAAVADYFTRLHDMVLARDRRRAPGTPG